MENETEFASSAFVNDLVNQAYKKLHDELRGAYGNEFWRKSASISVVADTATYALPSDFLTLLLVEYVDTAGYRYALRTFMMGERPYFQDYGTAWPFQGAPLRWRLGRRASTAIQQIEFSPIPTHSMNIEIEYIPVLPQLINDTDLADGTNGWDDFMVWDVVVGLMVRDNSDPSAAMAERENERKRIQAMASVSAQAEPERVIDVEALTASGYWWGQ
jgi:hypothetical protein